MRADPAVVAPVAAAGEGDQDGWNELAERYAPLVWSSCRRTREMDLEGEPMADAVAVGPDILRAELDAEILAGLGADDADPPGGRPHAQ